MLLIFVTAIIALLIIAGLISATETAITATSPGKIQQLISEGSKRAKKLKVMLKKKEKIISSLLIGNSIANTLCTTLATSIFIELFGDDLGTLLSSIVMSFVIIVFSEVVPKAIAVAKPEKWSLLAAPALTVFMKVLAPIIALLNYVVRFTFFMLRIDKHSDMSGADEVRGIIEHHHTEGNVVKDDRDMLGGILDIRNLIVGDIMIHRSKINSFNIDDDIEKIVKFVLESEHTRIPVWQGDPDNIIGILHVRDLLKKLQLKGGNISAVKVSNLLAEPWFVSEDALVTQQLQAFREGQSHLACVVDEYGELQGIITLEDILEEIVGQIYDEYDIGKNKIVKLSEQEYTIEGSVAIRDLNREFGWNLPEAEANTIAGFMINEMQRIPNKGEFLTYKNIKLVVKTKSAHRIKTVKIFVTREVSE